MVRSVAYDQSSIGAVTRIRWSPPGNPDDVRSRSTNTARSRRFVRFLATAVPTERGIANAKRGSCVASDRTTSRIGPRPRREPSSRSREKARWPVSRPITPTSGRGPSGDENEERHGRLECSSGTGTRASWHVCGRWADRDASSVESFVCCRSRCGSNRCGLLLVTNLRCQPTKSTGRGTARQRVNGREETARRTLSSQRTT